MIKLHPQLEKDCIPLGSYTLCSLLLLNDSNYPWFILLPNREGITEIHQLSEAEQVQLMAESMHFSRCLEAVFQPDKLNIAALGNVVPQLHIHHIARFIHDACWPAPVWGTVEAIPYDENQIKTIKKQMLKWLDSNRTQVFNSV